MIWLAVLVVPALACTAQSLVSIEVATFPVSSTSNASDIYSDVVRVGTLESGTVNRVLLYANLSALPDGAAVVNASLQLNVVDEVGVNTTVTLHIMTKEWNTKTLSNVSWTSPGLADSEWGQPGGDFAFNATEVDLSSGAGQLAFDINPSIISEWRRDSNPNNGWILKLKNELDINQSFSFSSSTSANRPRLAIAYEFVDTTTHPITTIAAPEFEYELVFHGNVPGLIGIPEKFSTAFVRKDGIRVFKLKRSFTECKLRCNEEPECLGFYLYVRNGKSEKNSYNYRCIGLRNLGVEQGVGTSLYSFSFKKVNGTSALPPHEVPGLMPGVTFEVVFDTQDPTLESRRFSSSFRSELRLFREFNGLELCKTRCAETNECLGIFTYVAQSAGGVLVCDGVSSLGTREGSATSLVSQSFLKRRAGEFAAFSQILGIMSLLPTGVSFPFPSVLSALAAGDFNNDGLKDVVAGFLRFGPGSANVLAFDQATFGQGRTTSLLSNVNCVEMLAADVNNDGYDDLLVADFDHIDVLINSGQDGIMSFFTNRLTDVENLQEILLHDADDDGDDDLFVLSATDSSVTVLVNSNGDFTLAGVLDVSNLGLIEDMVVYTGHDNDTVVVVGNTSVVMSYHVYLNPNNTIAVAAGEVVYRAAGRRINQLALGHLEHTNKTDLAIVFNTGSVAIVPHMDATLAFVFKTNITSNIVSFHAAEVSGDQYDDLIISGQTQSRAGAVFVYRNIGPNIGERFRVSYSQGFQDRDAVQVLISDINNDSKPDMVAASIQKFLEYRLNSPSWQDIRL